jgi:hypothetical protein
MRTLLIFLLSLSIEVFSHEIITLEKGFKLGEKLDENGIYVKGLYSFDFDDSYIYLPDSRYGTIIKAELRTGKLVKTISSKGQGPAELERPFFLLEKNGKIYVYDAGYNGIKIFDKEGNYINSFRTLMPEVVLFLPIVFAVNDKEEVFVSAPDLRENKLVTVYDGKTGKKIRSMIRENFKVKEGSLEYLKNCTYRIKIDREGNLYLLFPYKYLIRKYNKNGEILWEKRIEDELLNKFIKKFGGSKTGLKTFIGSFDVSESGVIFIVHSGGGCVLNRNGEIFLLFKGTYETFPILRVKNEIFADSVPISSFLSLRKIPTQIKKIL